MDIIAKILVGLVALEHLYFLYMEMFLWTTPRVRKIFGTTEAFAQESKTLAANQGLYNGFLAAGLIWSILHPDLWVSTQLAAFFLVCVFVAGVYGGLTANRRILYVQALPAGIAMLSLLGPTVFSPLPL